MAFSIVFSSKMVACDWLWPKGCKSNIIRLHYVRDCDTFIYNNPQLRQVPFYRIGIDKI